MELWEERHTKSEGGQIGRAGDSPSLRRLLRRVRRRRYAILRLRHVRRRTNARSGRKRRWQIRCRARPGAKHLHKRFGLGLLVRARVPVEVSSFTSLADCTPYARFVKREKQEKKLATELGILRARMGYVRLLCEIDPARRLASPSVAYVLFLPFTSTLAEGKGFFAGQPEDSEELEERHVRKTSNPEDRNRTCRD